MHMFEELDNLTNFEIWYERFNKFYILKAWAIKNLAMNFVLKLQ